MSPQDRTTTCRALRACNVDSGRCNDGQAAASASRAIAELAAAGTSQAVDRQGNSDRRKRTGKQQVAALERAKGHHGPERQENLDYGNRHDTSP